MCIFHKVTRNKYLTMNKFNKQFKGTMRRKRIWTLKVFTNPTRKEKREISKEFLFVRTVDMFNIKGIYNAQNLQSSYLILTPNFKTNQAMISNPR